MEVEADVGTEQIGEAPESLFSTIDILLIVALLAGGAWYLLKNRRKQVEAPGKSYTIQ